jgi:type II secretory pathway pseudopilin PulG
MRLGSFHHRVRQGSKRQQGYVLLLLMFTAAVILIGLSAALPSITGAIRRDREEELIHRGAQYARAIKKFYKKTRAYPVNLDQLVNTNNVRFLRKKYKDPITGKDFRLLRLGDVQVAANMPGISAGIAGPLTAAAATAAASATPAAPVPSTLPLFPGTVAANAAANTGSSANPAVTPGSSASQAGTPGAPPTATTTTGITPGTSATGTDTTGASSASLPGTSSSPFSSLSGAKGPATLGGGPIVGVASTSEKQSFHVFNQKDHYNDWQFIYDPTQERVGPCTACSILITGPYNGPPKFGGGQIPGAVSPSQMQPGTAPPGAGQTGLGGLNPGGFGQPSMPGGLGPGTLGQPASRQNPQR